MFELQRHGFTQTRNWVPDGMFHDRFPKGAQVNRYESTVAYVYTQGSAFAFEANKLCFEEKWGELFEQYGHIMRCLWMYVEKMQARYGTSQTLYRGMQGLWDEFQLEYQVGSCLEWCSFTSTSTSKDAALDLALGQYSGGNEFPKRPVLFVIQRRSISGLHLLHVHPQAPHDMAILLKQLTPLLLKAQLVRFESEGRALGIDISHRRFIAVYLSSFWEAIVKHPVRHPVSCLSEAMSPALQGMLGLGSPVPPS